MSEPIAVAEGTPWNPLTTPRRGANELRRRFSPQRGGCKFASDQPLDWFRPDLSKIASFGDCTFSAGGMDNRLRINFTSFAIRQLQMNPPKNSRSTLTMLLIHTYRLPIWSPAGAFSRKTTVFVSRDGGRTGRDGCFDIPVVVETAGIDSTAAATCSRLSPLSNRHARNWTRPSARPGSES